MDPITHAFAGALLGKAFFADRAEPAERPAVAGFIRPGGVEIFALTLGAVFPDVDVVAQGLSRDPMAIVKYHRGITHSFVALPVWAALLAWLTRWAAKRWGFRAPSWGMLTVIYGFGIASHIALDGMTSFGTRMWTPISSVRVSWDMLFIVDFALAAILLLPQLVAWVYCKPRGAIVRGLCLWAASTGAAVGGWYAAGRFGTPFHGWIVVLASAICAALFFGPAIGDWGFRIRRSHWCRAGVGISVAYLIACGAAHHAALGRAERFVAANRVQAERIGAIPMPPSLLEWSDAIRTRDGVYYAHFDLRQPAAQAPTFEFLADSPPDRFIERAMLLPEVRLYWTFARFPVIRSYPRANGGRVVEFEETRFLGPRKRAPNPFTFDVLFDAAGNAVEEGWRNRSLLPRKMRTIGARGEAP